MLHARCFELEEIPAVSPGFPPSGTKPSGARSRRPRPRSPTVLDVLRALDLGWFGGSELDWGPGRSSRSPKRSKRVGFEGDVPNNWKTRQTKCKASFV